MRSSRLSTGGTALNSLLSGSVVLTTSTAGASHVVVLLRAAYHISLNESQNLLNQLDGVRSLQEGWVNGGSGLPLHVQEVSLVLGVSLDLLADLGELVVGHEQVLAVNGLVV